MKKIDKDIFEKNVAAAINATTEVYDMIEPILEYTERRIKNELVGTMMDKLDSVPFLEDMVMKLICLRAFYEQIPHLDIVLTPTGFGVVSNGNVAPASADRVKSLREQIKNSYDDAYDECISMLIGTDWKDSSQAVVNIHHILYTGKMLQQYADKPNAHHSDLVLYNSEIFSAEERIIRKISSNQFDELLNKIRSDEFLKEESLVIFLCCKYIGLCIMKKYNEAITVLDRIENTLENNLEAFPLYKESAAYKVKHFEHYKNGQEDSTFFWG